MIAVLRQRNFALLWFGGLTSMSGDWMLNIALPIYVYGLTGSALATGTVFAAGLLPTVLLGSVAGVFVDRWDRRRTMVFSNLLMAACITPLLLVPQTGWLWIVYAVAFVQSSIGVFFSPAENSLLPRLVADEHLMAANSLNAMNNNLARLGGPALGGIVAGLSGLVGVVVVDAATYLIAAALIQAVSPEAGRPLNRIPDASGSEPREATAAAASFAAVWHEWLEGLRLVTTGRVILTVFLMIAVMGLGEGVLAALFAPFVSETLGGGALELGWFMSSQAVGGLIGGVVVGFLARKLSPSLLLGVSALVFGLLDLVIFVYPVFIQSIVLGIVLFVLVGIPATGIEASFLTLMQRAVEDRYRGRAFGALGTTQALLMLVGAMVGGLLGDVVGIVAVLVAQGSAYVLAGLLVLLLLGSTVGVAKKADSWHRETPRNGSESGSC